MVLHVHLSEEFSQVRQGLSHFPHSGVSYSKYPILH